MNWFQKQQPSILAQSSSIPYVILDDGVLLCFDNFFEEKPPNDKHLIEFNIDKSQLNKKSTYIHKFKKFPILIPFEDIIKLDNVIINGKILKTATKSPKTDDISISIVHGDKLEHCFDEYSENLSNFDYNFVLHDGEHNDFISLIEDNANSIYHDNWYRTAVTVADYICDIDSRKYKWTNSIPPLTISCFGLNSNDEKDNIQDSFEKIGIQEISVIWED